MWVYWERDVVDRMERKTRVHVERWLLVKSKKIKLKGELNLNSIKIRRKADENKDR